MYFIISLERGLLDEQLKENAPVSMSRSISGLHDPSVREERKGLTQRSIGPLQGRTPSHLEAIQAGDTKE